MDTMKYLSRLALGAVTAVAMTAGAVSHVNADANMPGEGKSISMARADWSTGYFHAEIYRQMFEKLGYDVSDVKTLNAASFYAVVGQDGGQDLWVNGWFPLHDEYRDNFQDGASLVGYVAQGGALQGYLVDKKSADEYGITSIMDFQKPEIKEAFDANGDGKADLVACPPGWGCEKKITKDFEELGLGEFINQIKAGYQAAMADAIARFDQGEPILFYTWTPNWTVNELAPGEDVVWIEMPDATEDETAEIDGCVDNPCELGWVANDIRPVANDEFMADNPAVKTLLEEARIPLADIYEQNAKMKEGEDDDEDIERHASEWIEANNDLVNGWLEKAREAAM